MPGVSCFIVRGWGSPVSRMEASLSSRCADRGGWAWSLPRDVVVRGLDGDRHDTCVLRADLRQEGGVVHGLNLVVRQRRGGCEGFRCGQPGDCCRSVGIVPADGQDRVSAWRGGEVGDELVGKVWLSVFEPVAGLPAVLVVEE